MSVSDLQKLGLLRPESEWGAQGVGRSAYPIRTGALALIGVCGCVAMALGGGTLWTWLGLIGFLVALLIFVWVNINAVVDETPSVHASSEEE